MLTQDSLVEPRRDLQNDNKMCLISGSDEDGKGFEVDHTIPHGLTPLRQNLTGPELLLTRGPISSGPSKYSPPSDSLISSITRKILDRFYRSVVTLKRPQETDG